MLAIAREVSDLESTNVLDFDVMANVTGARRTQIDAIQKKVEEELSLIQDTKQKLEVTLRLMDNVSETAQAQMSRNASSSTSRRGKGETTDIGHTMDMYKEIVQNTREAIRIREEHIGQLQAEKQSLENFERGM